jgi:hypothetical protein
MRFWSWPAGSSSQRCDLHGSWDDPSMLLSMVSALARNLFAVPAAVLRSRAAKDAQVWAFRHENAVLRRQIARSPLSLPTGSGLRSCPG